MKKVLIPFLMLTFLFTIVDDASAQRRGKKKRRTKEKTEQSDDSDNSKSRRNEEESAPSIMDKLNPEIKLGNINFFNNQFQLSLKSNIGYKFNKTFSAGVGGKFDYIYVGRPGPGDESFFSYGGLAYGRAKLGRQFYLQGEYNIYNSAFTLPRSTFNYFNAGIGYMYEGFDWSSGFELLVPLSDEIRDRFGIVEYWFSFSKNF